MLSATSPMEVLFAYPPSPPCDSPSINMELILFFPCSHSDLLLSCQGTALAHPDSLTSHDLVILIDGSFPLSFGKDVSGLLTNSSIWTDGSFPFGKRCSGGFANGFLWGAEVTLSFRVCPVCLNFSAKACAILQILRWSWKHQQVCQFSFLLLFSDYRYVLAALSHTQSFLLPQTFLQICQKLSSLFFLLSGYNGSSGANFFQETTLVMS